MTTAPTEGIAVRVRGGHVVHSPLCPRPDLTGVKITRIEGELTARCRHCSSAYWVPDAVHPPPRYVLGCCRCGVTIRRYSAKPVIPLCDNCKRRSLEADR